MITWSQGEIAYVHMFCFAWWIFHIISKLFNCSDSAKRVAKAMISAKVIFLPKLVPRIFGLFSFRKPGWIFSYEPKAEFVPVSGPARSTGHIWRGPKIYFALRECSWTIFLELLSMALNKLYSYSIWKTNRWILIKSWLLTELSVVTETKVKTQDLRSEN